MKQAHYSSDGTGGGDGTDSSLSDFPHGWKNAYAESSGRSDGQVRSYFS